LIVKTVISIKMEIRWGLFSMSSMNGLDLRLHPKQAMTLDTDATEVLYGGAAGGGPPGKRNGQYRHGERTKAAIAERQKFSALLKLLRAGLI
jgi:hypothetical protein